MTHVSYKGGFKSSVSALEWAVVTERDPDVINHAAIPVTGCRTMAGLYLLPH